MLRSRPCWFTAAAAAGACLPLAVLPAAAQVSAPVSGVVCDETSRICYDRQGVSLALTQEYFGRYGLQNLQRQLGGNPAPSEFRLSNGITCSTAARSCWREGWGGRQVDASLSQQLYGGGGGFNPFNPTNPNRTEQTDAGTCQLYRGMQRLFSGACSLRRVSHTDQSRTRFDATLANGSRYSFRQRDGVTVIQDSSGNSWPVTAAVQGSQVRFRWADMQLNATRNDGTALGSGSGLNEALGVGLTNLLNTLFR